MNVEKDDTGNESQKHSLTFFDVFYGTIFILILSGLISLVFPQLSWLKIFCYLYGAVYIFLFSFIFISFFGDFFNWLVQLFKRLVRLFKC